MQKFLIQQLPEELHVEGSEVEVFTESHVLQDAKRKVVEDKPKPKPSPAQVMMNRYKMMQEKALEAEREAKEKIKEKVREISAKNKEKAAAVGNSMFCFG